MKHVVFLVGVPQKVSRSFVANPEKSGEANHGWFTEYFYWQVSAHAAPIVMEGEILRDQGLHSPARRRKIADVQSLTVLQFISRMD